MSSGPHSPQLSGPQALGFPPGFDFSLPPGTPGAPAAHDAAEGFNLGDLMRTFKQRRVTIILTTVTVYILVVIATFITLRYFPTYPSEAVFELSPPRSTALITTERDLTTDAMQQLLKTEANKLRGLDLLLEVVGKPEVKRTSYYQTYKDSVMEAAVGLQEDLKVAPLPESRLIRVSFGWRNRDEARDIVKAIADAYRVKFSDKESGAAFKQLEQIKAQASKLRQDLETKREQIKRYRENRTQPNMEAERDAYVQWVAQLRQDQSTLEAQIAQVEARLNSYTNAAPDRYALTAEQLMIVETDPQLRFNRSQVEALEVEVRALATRLGDQHREVQVLRARQNEYRENEATRREELISQTRQRTVENLRDDRAGLIAAQSRLIEELQSAESSQRDIDAGIQQVMQFTEDLRRIEEQLREVSGQELAAQASYDNRENSRLNLVQEARSAVEASFPNLLVFLGGGAFLALASGFGLAFLREFTDRAVRTPIDVVRHSKLSVLGSVPALDYEEANVDVVERAVEQAPQSLIAEAFRQVRTNLQFSGPGSAQKVLLITSPGPGDGKTTVLANLGVTLANGGQRVLLIDCNFRRPALRGMFTQSRPEGLSNILIGEGSLDDFVTPTTTRGMSMLSTGPMPPRPSELLGSQPMRDLLRKAAGQYDRVLLDGPPVLLMSDALVLSGVVDGVLLVARAEQNSRGTLKRARDQLAAVGAKVFGAVLNGVKARAGGYFRKQYREFYEYTSDATIPQELTAPKRDDDDKNS